MNTKQTRFDLEQHLETLQAENKRLKEELAQLKEQVSNQPDVSFKEKYAVKILNSIPDMLTVFTNDEVGVEILSSEETNHVGISAEEFVGMRMCDMIPPDAYQNVHANMQKAIATGKASLAHHELVIDGVRHYYENRIFPLDDRHTLIMCRDVTDATCKRNELRELNFLLEGILNNIPVYLFVKDPQHDFRYLYWNKAFCDYSKIPAQKAIGHTDFEIFPQRADAEKFRRDDLEVFRTSERMDRQETYVSAIGETRIVQTLKALVPMEGREPLLIGISWDITKFENIEQRLIEATIKAEQSDRLKSAFLANMSHEIRTPLNAIVGFSKLLATADSPEDTALYSDIINQNSEILLQLINDILDLSKIEAGTLEYVKRRMNLGELCRTIYEVHKDRVHERVTLILDNKEEDLMIDEDNNRIMQVITNLITNAIKFTSEGEIRFGFEVKKHCIYVYVKDTGIGIEESKVNRIFDRFVKLNSFAQGTGLGLAICRMIIERIGGEIGATSELGKGSTFYFTIPYEKEKKGIVLTTFADEAETPVVVKPQQLKRILVAEDVESNFLLLKNIIGKHYTLFRAKDGIEAVELFKECCPDLVLMDIKMPRMSGLEATRIIRSYSKEVPIIALTAYAFETDKEAAFEAGCNDFVSKPVSEETLLKVLSKYANEG